jgi:hypothetical protein
MKLVRLLTLLTASAALIGPAAAGAAKRPVVVELFTSQGCSSCPPADQILTRLSQRRGILAMTLPVNYWDMLGWKDTLASETNTHRQKAYASAMGHGGVYTPQMIVDGVSDIVGSRDGEIEGAIARREAEIEVSQARLEAVAAAHEAEIAAREEALAEAAAYHEQARAELVAEREELATARKQVQASRKTAKPSLAVPVSVSESPTSMHIAVGDGEKNDTAATIWLFHLRDAVTVNIGGGENGGRTMTYRNVVGDLRSVGQWNGDPVALEIPRANLNGLPHDAVAVIVQQGGYGRVVGATVISHPDYGASH